MSQPETGAERAQADLLSPERQASLVERLRAGDADAETEFVQLFAGRLRLMIASRIRDREEARDLAQDALIAALRAVQAGQLRDAARLAAFVHGVARNLANSHVRRQASAPVHVELDPDVAIADHSADSREAEERLVLADRALDALAPHEREVLRLTLVEGLKPGAIATRLGLAVDVVRARKSRALKKVVAEVARLSRSKPGSY